MIILIANQKGGVGKSTLTTLLANYLVLEKKQEVLVLDLDFQDTVYQRLERDKKVYNNEPIYDVIKIDINDFIQYAKDLEEVKADIHIVVDMPGRLDDDTLLEIIKVADLIICPTNYEQTIFESTFFFASVAQAIEAKAQIIFQPTRVSSTIKYETESKVKEALAPYGVFAPKINERVALQRVDSFTISKDAMEMIKEPFEFIYQYISK